MKGYAAAASNPSAKRRCKGLTVTVFALVFCSLLVPLAFLLGRFPTGYMTDEQSSTESNFGSYGHEDGSGEQNQSEGDETRINVLVKKFAPDIPKAITEDIRGEVYAVKNTNSEPVSGSAHITSEPKNATSNSNQKDVVTNSKSPPAAQKITPKAPSSLNLRNGSGVGNIAKGSTGDGSERSCQLEFGSYCLWSVEHKEVLKDSMVKRLKDQLFVARSYYPSIAKLQGQEKLTRDLKQQIQEHERMLSEAISDADIPPLVETKTQMMDQVIATAKSFAVDCNNVDKKLRQILDLTEDEAHFHRKQSAFLYHLGAQTMPKSLHCLSMRLTVECFKYMPLDIEPSHAHKLDNPDLRHYIIFSRSILAVSVAINSTVMSSEETDDMVFHLLTDRQNFFAMKLWFTRNSYKKALIHVQNIEDLIPSHSLSPPEEFRISTRNPDRSSPIQMKTEYISVFGHSHFLLPQIFKNLKKVVILDDDVVIQRDLSFLWNLDLDGKVNGATEFCGVRMGQLKNYLHGSRHDGKACAWMSGLNVVDLDRWREHNVTGIYQSLLHKLSDGSEASYRAAALPISLLAFQDLIFPLDDSWILSGLGHAYGVTSDSMKYAVALHYNGNMKPWLDLGIPEYKKFWKKFLTKEETFMDACNVNP